MPAATKGHTTDDHDSVATSDACRSGRRPRRPSTPHQHEVQPPALESRNASARGTGLLLCLVLTTVMALGLYRHAATAPYPTAGPRPAADDAPPLRVDPNTAAWWELTALPGVGEVTAKKIIKYRQTYRGQRVLPPDAPVFHTAADLQRVKGIGPKKSKRMAPHLTFGTDAQQADESSHPPD